MDEVLSKSEGLTEGLSKDSFMLLSLFKQVGKQPWFEILDLSVTNSSTESLLNLLSPGWVPKLEDAFVVTDSLLNGLNCFLLRVEAFPEKETTGCRWLTDCSLYCTDSIIDHLKEGVTTDSLFYEESVLNYGLSS